MVGDSPKKITTVNVCVVWIVVFRLNVLIMAGKGDCRLITVQVYFVYMTRLLLLLSNGIIMLSVDIFDYHVNGPGCRELTPV